MNISEKVYWRMIQGELGCRTCMHLKKENKGVGVPCDLYTEWEGSMDCPFRACEVEDHD